MGFLTLILGVVNSFISVPAQTALQERSPENKRARVFSAFYTVSNAIIIFPVLFAAAMADTLGHVPTVAIIGAVVLLSAVVGLYKSRHRRGIAEPFPASDITPEEAEAALTTATPGARPIPAATQQQSMAEHKNE
jgi:MFS family permease